MKALSAFVVLALSSSPCLAATVSASSTEWAAFLGNYDFLADQQTGQPESDIVGNGSNPGFFMTFNNNGAASTTDGTIGFRLRLDAAGGNTNNPAFTRVAWIGVDANVDGAIDAFLGIANQGSSSTLGIFAPGNGANTSPSTTSIASSPAFSYTIGSGNYNYRPVNFTTDGGTTNDVTPSSSGDPDYYLSVLLPFGDLVSYLATKGITINDQSGMRFVVATSTQANSLNQDLGGVNGGTNSSTTWVALGGFSQVVKPGGSPIPEPSSLLLASSALLLGLSRRKR